MQAYPSRGSGTDGRANAHDGRSYDPSPPEASAYSYLFQQAARGKSTIGGQDAVQFMIRSQVPVPTLKQVWALASRGAPEMGLAEFNTAMRLIALAQKGVAIGPQTLEQTRGMQVPVPEFQGIETPKMPTPPPPAIARPAPAAGDAGASWTIANDVKANYKKIWDGMGKNTQGLLEGRDAAAFFAKSGQSRENLRTIWQLADSGADGKLDLGEFFVAMHLTMLVKKGVALPSAVPAELLQSVARGGRGEDSSSSFAAADTSNVSLNQSASEPKALSSRKLSASAAGNGNGGAVADPERQRLVSQLAETARTLQAETDRLRAVDDEVARARQEVGELRARLESTLGSVSAQLSAASAKLSEQRARPAPVPNAFEAF
jgi:hypothetical protein